MNNRSFTRKMTYIGLIASLLIPLSMVARPASVSPKSGGQLADLRDEFELSQGQMTEIDPASETMKLASLGLRGVAVSMLWMQSMEHKKKHNWDQVESTLNALVKIQPNFIKVWEYQAHNMSYNISMEFDDYEYRYRWVKKGISFLTRGLKPNYRDHRMTDNLGQFTGMKIGVADEKKQFRRLVRTDSDFHDEMAEFGIEKQSYFLGAPFLYDHWLLAYQWYDKSLKKVVVESYDQKTSDIMFHRKRPSQLRQSAAAIGKEFRTDEAIQLLWGRAHDEWLEYGAVPLGNTLRQVVSLEDLTRLQESIERKRKQLDEFAPAGLREQIVSEVESNANFTEDEAAALAIPDEQRDDIQQTIARNATLRMNQDMAKVDGLILEQVPESQKFKARKLVDQIVRDLADMRTIDKYQGTINYRYWRIRTLAEKDEIAIEARQLMDDARELQRQSVLDDEYEIDPKTGERKITRKGAISTYQDCYEKFAVLLDRYPRLGEGALADEIVDSLVAFKDMLSVAGLDWPEDFCLQDLVDREVDSSNAKGKLPSSEMLRQQKIESGEIDPDAENEEDSESSEESDSGEASDGVDSDSENESEQVEPEEESKDEQGSGDADSSEPTLEDESAQG